MTLTWICAYIGAATIAASAVKIICRIGGDR